MSTVSDDLEFWTKVIRSDGACWEWQGQRQKYKGNLPYGVARVDGKPRAAHRRAYELVFGEVPKGLQVLHKCDVAFCCSPFHIYAGTQKQNMQDCIERGRRPAKRGPYQKGFGSGQHLSKLTDEIVLQIRAEYVPHMVTLKHLGKKYGVGHQCILLIIQGKTWKHLLPAP